MKRLYTIGMALAIGAFSTQSFAQVQQLDAELTHPLTSIKKDKVKTNTATAKGTDETVIYWQEDFSNGLDGMGSNGAWDTEEDQGDLWFITYPIGSAEPEAYDPAAALVGASDAYGTNIPNYFGDRDVVSSPTRDNGVVMLDGDRWNSTSTEEAPDGTLTQNPFLASLVSPSMDLTGVENALLTFYHYSRVCCSGYALSTDISVDGGDTWIPYDVFTPYGDGNDDVDIQVSLNISEVLQGASDLSDCRIRFFWNGSQSHYFWSIDDIQITSLPDNDMVAGETWYNNYFDLIDDFELAENALPAVDYYREFEYLNTPDYFTRPFDFAMEVTNAGSQTQTDVQLNVTVTSPSGVVYNVSSPGVSIETTVTDTLMIENITYADILNGDPIEEGEYLIEYNVSQAEEDERPDDNTGTTRATNVSMENGEVPAYFRNDGNNYEGAYTTLGQDVIWGTPYVFTSTDEDKFITHVEAVFLFSEGFAETIAGEIIYFNVREGSVLEEDDTDPETITSVFFDSDNALTYEDGDLEYTIEESDIWNSDDGFPFVWVSFELPEPIMIEENKIYQAEYRVPAAGGGIVFPPVTGPQEKYASVLYDFADGAWFFLGTNAMPLRFRTMGADPDGVEDFATVQDGITLMQNFPNPFNSSTRIQYMLDDATTANFEVRDITGKVVYTENLGTVAPGVVNFIELNKGSLTAGVYTYSIVTPDYVVTRKLTVE